MPKNIPASQVWVSINIWIPTNEQELFTLYFVLSVYISVYIDITSLAVHMSIQKTYVHFHPPPRGGYDTLLRFLVKCIIVLVIWGAYVFLIFISFIFTYMFCITDQLFHEENLSVLILAPPLQVPLSSKHSCTILI